MNQLQSSIPDRLGLHAGDWVVVRSKNEILATLDEMACLDGLPFQPEMFAFCGQRMRVSKVAHKTCDNIHKTGGRRMLNAVHLEGGRCSGALHGGCQADCVFFWKESWLRRERDPVIEPEERLNQCAESTVLNRVRAPGSENSDDPVWVCQTTQLYDATGPLAWWDIRQYIRDVTTGNHSAWHMITLLVFAGYRQLVHFGVGYRYLIALFNWFQGLRGGKPFPLGEGVIPDGKPTPTELLNLEPGEWVEVRPSAEILQTITCNGFNRGMRYDKEMAKYSGGRYRVQMRVDRLINEQTGKMMTMKNPCIQLEDVFCRAECTDKRLGCPRASNTYWREIWLKRVSPSVPASEGQNGPGEST
jgi:hypothetical protein